MFKVVALLDGEIYVRIGEGFFIRIYTKAMCFTIQCKLLVTVIHSKTF